MLLRPQPQQCVVGDENGTDKARSGIYYMKKLADDPFPKYDDELSPADCETDKEACESDKADLDVKLRSTVASIHLSKERKVAPQIRVFDLILSPLFVA